MEERQSGPRRATDVARRAGRAPRARWTPWALSEAEMRSGKRHRPPSALTPVSAPTGTYPTTPSHEHAGRTVWRRRWAPAGRLCFIYALYEGLIQRGGARAMLSGAF